MIDFLHRFEPPAVLFSWGPITVYYYGLAVVFGIALALLIAASLSGAYGLSRNRVLDIAFYLIIFGIGGARLYEIFLELPYYLSNPGQILKIWEGGLAIHGAIIAGLLVLLISARRYRLSFWRLSSLFVPGLAVGQAAGRWGNYFNQELFGRPTARPWGIPIAPENRVWPYLTETHFHPTFLYESLGCLAIGGGLLALNWYFIRRERLSEKFCAWSTAAYMLSYSVLRIILESIRLDDAPIFFGLRWPQVASALIIIGSIYALINYYARSSEKQA